MKMWVYVDWWKRHEGGAISRISKMAVLGEDFSGMEYKEYGTKRNECCINMTGKKSL